MINITAIPTLNDNYVWLIENGSCAWIVDPGESGPVLRALNERNLTLAGILITHHHYDHIDGVKSIVESYPNETIPVFGPRKKHSPCVTHPLDDAATIQLAGIELTVLTTPGHTLDHIVYYASSLNTLFSGDTLFRFGCGRIFDGSSEALHHSLQRIAKLPADTIIYCTHEYTLQNLKFARWLDPDNQILRDAEKTCSDLRNKGVPTIPFTLSEQLLANPFLRANDPVIQKSVNERCKAELTDETAYFVAIRRLKDHF